MNKQHNLLESAAFFCSMGDRRSEVCMWILLFEWAGMYE